MSKTSNSAVKRYNLGHPQERLATFNKHKWNYDESVECSPTRLSEAGFYAITSECARCHYCQKEMEGWDPTDVPWEEHKSHCPDCPFIKFYSSPPKQVLVLDAIKLEKERQLYSLKLELIKAVASIEKCENQVLKLARKDN